MKILGLNITREKKEEKTPFIFGSFFSSDPRTDLSGFKLDFNYLFTTYRTQSDISNCVQEWQYNIGKEGYDWINERDESQEVPDKITDELDSILNFKKPWDETRMQTLQHLGITGNAYWFLIRNIFGDVIGVQVVDPRTMYIICDKHGNVFKYIQKDGRGGAIEYDAEEIIHFKFRCDPTHEIFGFSPIEAVLFEALTDIEAMMSNFHFFKNDAQPSLQFILEDGLTAEAKKKVVDSIKANLVGSKNRGRGGVFQGLKDIKSFSITRKDMEFLEGRTFTRRKICAAYGVPEFMLGYTESVNNNNGVELTKNTYETTYRPKEKILSAQITNGLLNRIGLDGIVSFKFKPQVFDMREIKKVAQEEKRLGIITARQYKIKTGEEITEEDERNPNFDKHIIHQGRSAILLEEINT